MKPKSKIIISLLMITSIFICSQVNVLYAGNDKTVEASVRNEFTDFSLNSLAPTNPREATFDDEVYSMNESIFIDLKPALPLEADINDDNTESDLTSESSLPEQPSVSVNASDKKSPEMKQLQKILKTLLVSPDFTLNEQEDNAGFYVTFILSGNGKITVKDMTAPSKRIEEYVKQRLSVYVANNSNNIYPYTYKVKIRFENS
ncbi:MAG: hypothetical protein NTW31_00820 [Bacteroidetes bacterium]|nr:hypothetical protein [Bacteroidota bacterium]